MRKTIFLTLFVLCLLPALQAQTDWILNGESALSVRTKLNALKVSFDSLSLVVDTSFFKQGTLSITGCDTASVSFYNAFPSDEYSVSGLCEDTFKNQVLYVITERLTTGFKVLTLDDATFYWIAILKPE